MIECPPLPLNLLLVLYLHILEKARTLTHLQRAILSTSVQLEVMDADSCDDVSLPPGITGAVGERHLIVALTCPQQTQVLTDEVL